MITCSTSLTGVMIARRLPECGGNERGAAVRGAMARLEAVPGQQRPLFCLLLLHRAEGAAHGAVGEVSVELAGDAARLRSDATYRIR